MRWIYILSILYHFANYTFDKIKWVKHFRIYHPLTHHDISFSKVSVLNISSIYELSSIKRTDPPITWELFLRNMKILLICFSSKTVFTFLLVERFSFRVQYFNPWNKIYGLWNGMLWEDTIKKIHFSAPKTSCMLSLFFNDKSTKTKALLISTTKSRRHLTVTSLLGFGTTK